MNDFRTTPAPMNSLGMTLYRHGAALLAGRGLRRYAFVNRLNSMVLRCVRPHEAEVLGHRMLLDRRDSLDLSLNGIYEPLETRIAETLVTPGGCVVDVGANIGYYTLLCARRAGPAGQIYAFEPEPENFSLLQQNVRRNGYRNVQMENAAVSSATGSLKLFVSEENHGDHRVYASENDSRRHVSIRAVRLDDYFADDLPLIDLLKMDIQGAEGHALGGMKTLLQCRPPRAILTEFWPLGLRRAGTEASGLLRLLESNGYQLAHLDERRREPVPITAAELLGQFTEANGHQTNLLARHD